MNILNSNFRSRIILTLLGTWLLFPGTAMSIPSGISGYSGASGPTCTACHPTGAAVPTVTLSADSNATVVSPGSNSSYTLTMTGGPASNAGLDVAASGGTIIDTNPSGTRILNGELTMSAPNPVSGGSISWTFDWQAPTVSGTYTLYAAALSGNGTGGTSNDGTGTTSLQVTVSAPANQPPNAMISGPTTRVAGIAVTFDGSGSSDSDGNIVSYDWDLGDGTAASGVSTTHAYTEGSYTVVLMVTDNSGNTGHATLVIDITASNIAPVAVISGPANGTEGIAVSFDGSGSSDADGNVVSYDWYFGDNSAGSGATVSHIYSAGIYIVTLTVTDDMGATDSTSLNIDIAATTEPQPPVADAGGPYSADLGVAVQFDGSASMDADGSIASYSWNFGDGSANGSGVGPVHIYTAAGNFTVVLTVTDDQGLTGSAQTTADITEIIIPPPEPEPQTGEELYNTYCSSCHGANGVGGPDGDVVGASTSSITSAIASVGDMRFLSGTLSTSDIEAIAAFLDGNAPPPGPEPEPEPQTGETLYNTYCSSCHGANGRGGPDGDVTGESAEDIAEAIEEEREMRFLADALTNSDIEAIAAFLNDGNDDGDDRNCDANGDRDDGRHGDHDGDRDGDHDGHRDGDRDRNSDSNDDRNCSDDSDRSSNVTNPFANANDGESTESGGGTLHWLMLLLTTVLLAVRRHR